MPVLLPSELPVLARTRHHWIVLFRLPSSRLRGIALLVLLLLAIIVPNPMAWVLGIIVILAMFFRWHTWYAEAVILTSQRIIRVQGVPETTRSEASLRLDRISGGRLVQTVAGKILHYGDIELEAPGEHPDVRRLRRIANPRPFYIELRRVLFGEELRPDPNDMPSDQITEPLPVPPKEPDGSGGGWTWDSGP